MRPICGGRSEVAQFRPYSRLMYQPSVSIFILCCAQASGDDSIMVVRFRCRAMKPNISLRSPVSIVLTLMFTTPPRRDVPPPPVPALMPPPLLLLESSDSIG